MKREGPQLARPAGVQQPASPACACSSRPAQLARPAQQAARRAAHAHTPPRFTCSRCHPGPARQPLPATGSSSSRRRFPSPTKPRHRWQVRVRGHAGSMTLSPPWRHAHATSTPTTPACDAVRCQRRITSRSPLELEAPAIKAPALVALAHSHAHRHLAATPCTPEPRERAKRERG